MKFYLSSYRLGNQSKKLKRLVTKNKTAVYISNALDWRKFTDDLERRKKHEERDMQDIRALGFNIELLDLRDYFNKPKQLEAKLKTVGLIWVSGGNTFVLRQAMKLSGFDVILKKLMKTDLVYAGYSAGICVLAPSLRGLDIVDDPKQNPYKTKVIWEGLGILDYLILPHYQSDHPESKDIDKELQYCIENGILFKVLRDGEVMIIE
ncbi:Type 1 glutamine amidotransferase-like domain-containing protein [Candidatus Woesearchaeota archaeon]|nr:Type 1 glutamine amidotransferase-like domain-containing protein [Candidatus Woesearchaeota archaeon]